MTPFRHLPLSRKTLLGLVPLFLLFVTLSVVLQNNFQEQEMMEQAQASAATYASIIKESLVSMMVTNLAVDNSFLARLNALQQFDSVRICVNDLHLRRELLTPERELEVAGKQELLRAADDTERSVLASGEATYHRIGDQYRAVVPFTATAVCQKCHAVPLRYALGAADLRISFARITQANSANWRRSSVIFVVFALAAIAAATLIFTRYVARPVDRLVDATKEIGRGNLDYAVAPAGRDGGGESGDELAFLAGRFNEMRLMLREKIRQLDGANESLLERNREVEETLTRLRKAQEDLVRSERLAVTARMTAQLSHEINNPIHNIQSLLESLRRKAGGAPAVQELIGVALEEIGRMAQLTRQMLAVYRDSMVEERKDELDLREVVEEVARAHRESLSVRGITLRVDNAPGPAVIAGVRDKLKQLFLNLILNARDAMPAGGTITCTVGANAGGIEASVRDTGTGIPPEHIDRIFDAFFTTKKEVSGVGLGLFVCYGVVQQHGGSIRVDSEPGRGTTFTLRFPAATKKGEADG